MGQRVVEVAAVPRRSRVRDESKALGRRGARRRVYFLDVDDDGARWKQPPRRPSHLPERACPKKGSAKGALARGVSRVPRVVAGRAPFASTAPASALPTPKACGRGAGITVVAAFDARRWVVEARRDDRPGNDATTRASGTG